MMRSPTTAREAIEQSILLWEALTTAPYERSFGRMKQTVANTLRMRLFRNYCPLCEYAHGINPDEMCGACPVWPKEKYADQGFACEYHPDSPYRRWVRAHYEYATPDGIHAERQAAAREFVELLKKKLEEV